MIELRQRVKYLEREIGIAKKSILKLEEILADTPAWYKPELKLSNVKAENRTQYSKIKNNEKSLQIISAAIKIAQKEFDTLKENPKKIEICYEKTQAWINGASTSLDIIKFYQSDPAGRIFNVSVKTRLSTSTANSIIKYRNNKPNKYLINLEELVKNEVISEDILYDLFYSGCQLPDPSSGATTKIGVLLPLKIESRFYEPSPQNNNWRLRVRLIPDDISIDNHNPLVSEEEFSATDTFYNSVNGDMDSLNVEDAWSVFAREVGKERAAWLVRKFEPKISNEQYAGIGRPDNFQDDIRFSQLRGLPEIIEIWMAIDKNEPIKIKELKLKRNEIESLEIVDFNKNEGKRWWNSYTKAKEVGMATEIELDESRPDNIDVLYAVGISDEAPDQLFQSHRDKGSLSILNLGDSTNTVSGKPAVNMDEDINTWLDIARGQTASGTWELGSALTGLGDKLEPIQGPVNAKPWELNNALVNCLWPVLWGHSLKDIWGLGSNVHYAGLWAGDVLYPEGALPPIRIRQQPYGIIPATSLTQWKVNKKDPFIERLLLPSLIKLRKIWAKSARNSGTIVDADSDKALEILGQTPSSNRYMYRNFFSLNIFSLLYHGFLSGLNFDTLNNWWMEKVSAILGLGLEPKRRYASVGYPQHLDLPLVEPDNLPEDISWQDAIDIIKNMPPKMLIDPEQVKTMFGGVMPNSLLLRLLIHSLTVGMAEVSRSSFSKIDTVLEKEFDLSAKPTKLAMDAFKFTSTSMKSSPSRSLLNNFYNYLDVIRNTPVEHIERAFRSVLDSAAYRIDPWITGYAWRKFKTLNTQRPDYVLGVYGWVDSPKPGNPGPTEGGLLHAPSEQQCYTSIILRDKVIHGDESDQWKMNLDSKSIRDAEKLAKKVRAGNNLQELLGREVEFVVGKKSLIKSLRKKFPLRDENGIKRVCNGQAVLNHDAGSLNLPIEILNQLKPIRQALDVYGDLLVAEAVNHVVQGRGEIAGGAMEAAAGFAEPPTLDVIKTPRSGRSVQSTVCFCLPVVDAPALNLTISPTLVADASVATWIKQQTGGETSSAWKWKVISPNGNTEISLSEINLLPCDTVGLSTKSLHGLVLEQAANDGSIDQTSEADLSHKKAQRIIKTLGARPAVSNDLIVDGSILDTQSIKIDFINRINALKNHALDVLQSFNDALVSNDIDKKIAIHTALKWGVFSIEEAELTLDEKLQGAIDALLFRVEKLPAELDTFDPTELAQLIAEFVTNDGQYAVLSHIDIAKTNKTLRPVDRVNNDKINSFDKDWLSIVSTIRTSASRLEAYQLEELVQKDSGPLHAWSNFPNDPWQKNIPIDPETSRIPDSHLIVTYGPKDVLKDLVNKDTLVCAVGLIDSWSETVPFKEHATTAGFGFNAPSSRAQQSILLAIPPADSTVLENETLINIVHETRELSHARMAKANDIHEFAGGISSMMFPVMGKTGINLEPEEKQA